VTSSQITLFGATGYTGRLTASALVHAGLAPVLAGRSANRLAALVDELTPFAPKGAAPTWRTADVYEPASIRALIEDPTDVLITTVGPFLRLGRPALDAAIDAGAGYVDSTGEPPFVRYVFTEGHARAIATGARLLTAFGYDYVPGNLAGALVLDRVRRSGEIPARIDVGYFIRGGFGISSGTRASAMGMLLEPSFAYRGGSIRPERTAKRVQSFRIAKRTWQGLSIGGSEHFTLPRIAPTLQQVDVYLGWAGRMTQLASKGSAALSALRTIPGVPSLLSTAAERRTTTGEGPDASARRASKTVAVAVAYDGVGRHLDQVSVEGPNPYELTAETLAWGAAMLRAERTDAAGALGPADAFGLAALVDGCTRMGLRATR
jgi:short subunit dehydrogenase-like uncharacterized protein